MSIRNLLTLAALLVAPTAAVAGPDLSTSMTSPANDLVDGARARDRGRARQRVQPGRHDDLVRGAAHSAREPGPVHLRLREPTELGPRGVRRHRPDHGRREHTRQQRPDPRGQPSELHHPRGGALGEHQPSLHWAGPDLVPRVRALPELHHLAPDDAAAGGDIDFGSPAINAVYTGTWSQPSPDRLVFQYFDYGVLAADFDGYGVPGGCFEGLTVFPDSEFVSIYEVCPR